MYIKLNNRLQTIADMIPDGASVADVGTDHALLPVYLALNRDCGRLIATDINEQPLMRAAHTVYENDVRGLVELRLCDGLAGVRPDETDCIVIAGLGGDTIVSILDAAAWVKDASKTLILQPMSRSESVREYLVESGFEITGETVVRDGSHLYTVMRSQYTGDGHAPCEAWYRCVGETVKNSDELSREYVRRQLERLQTAADGMRRSADSADREKAKEIEATIETIKRIGGMK